jgi:hypothetical protein
MENNTTGVIARAKLWRLLKYVAIGLCVALALSRWYPGFTYCLKQNCSIVFTVLNVIIFWVAVAFWPLVLGGVALGKLTIALVSLA